MKVIVRTLGIAPLLILAAGCARQDHTPPPFDAANAQPVGPPEDAVITHAPEVPPPINRHQPKKLVVKLEVQSM